MCQQINLLFLIKNLIKISALIIFTWQVSSILASEPAKSSAPQAALTVTVTQPQSLDWPRLLTAWGNVTAWQEAIISAEISNYRLTAVLVEVGDWVKRDQLLVQIADETIKAELAAARASVAEAEASLAAAQADGERARHLKNTPALSAQQSTQYLTTEQMAAARLTAARARVQTEELRLAQTQVLAPDDGIISARLATVGSLAQPNQELVRLIRGGRLEWRAEVLAEDLSHLAKNNPAQVITPDGQWIVGKIRWIAPTVNPQTLTGLVAVDLPALSLDNHLKAGMFLRGEFILAKTKALTVPQSAVVLQNGFAYVFCLSADNRVIQIKVTVGRRKSDRIEITSGLDKTVSIIDSGVGFLADGDLVRVSEK